MEFPHKKLSIDIPYYSFKLSIFLKILFTKSTIFQCFCKFSSFLPPVQIKVPHFINGIYYGLLIRNWSFLEISLNNVPLPKTKFLQVIVLPGQLNQLLTKGLNLIKELVLRLREFCSAVRTLESCKISLPDGVWSGRQSWNQISCRRFRTGMCTNLSFCLILMRLVLWASSMTFLLLLMVHHRPPLITF